MKRILLAIFFCSIFSIKADTNNVERPLVVIIPSYNNKKWCAINLKSVLRQDYNNFRVIYINDCSTDGTGELVQRFLERYDIHNRITLINNSIRCGALANLYNAIHSCDDREIVVCVDGDDFLAHDQVFSYLNSIYEDENIWLTYGQYQEFPIKNLGFCRSIPQKIVAENKFRQYSSFPVSHLRTFYAWLFKKVAIKDLLYQGEFYWMTWDKAMMLPMIEMAGERFKFINKILYCYNAVNPINDHKVDEELQTNLRKVILALEPYQRLEGTMQEDRQTVNNFINIIVFNNEKNLIEQEKITYYLKDTLGELVEVTFITSDEINFSEKFKELIETLESNYVLMIDNNDYPDLALIDFQELMFEMKKINASIFTFGDLFEDDMAGKFIPLSETFIGWQFGFKPSYRAKTFALCSNVYSKEMVLKRLTTLNFANLKELKEEWRTLIFDEDEFGICLRN